MVTMVIWRCKEYSARQDHRDQFYAHISDEFNASCAMENPLQRELIENALSKGADRMIRALALNIYQSSGSICLTTSRMVPSLASMMATTLSLKGSGSGLPTIA